MNKRTLCGFSYDHRLTYLASQKITWNKTIQHGGIIDLPTWDHRRVSPAWSIDWPTWDHKRVSPAQIIDWPTWDLNIVSPA
ncbi:hypothetical protein DPMN_048317 [Dreissena polymorpha]|uniref:Uncharacterized protein n=1 Tax=Dreissena polymorpha TaxID=45954 RepID=A0A9D4I2S4_DREPO|nr:hypothetical protein DPMN_048317 [Dreissena polymorpha]